ncbi:MAG: hypothetical protein HY707_03855 [Ignavibacteriae bacterium]|nr:hypothetical protein [Ignavibacteriota bacterium]
MGWDVVKLLARKVAQAGESPEGRKWLFIAPGIGLLINIGLFVFQIVVPNVAIVITAVVILLSPAIFFLIGFDRARSDDPIRKLFHQPDAVKAPYLLACAAALHRKPDVSDRDKRKAIEELGAEIRELNNEIKYIGAMINDVKTHSVWAVCGRKTDHSAPSFYEANQESFDAGNYIERAFLPPTTVAEAASIQKAIQAYHFPKGMLVRALNKNQNADDVRHAHILPPGFGMTIMGECNRLAGNPQCDPDSKYAVLIHWGGMDSAGTHYGVVLRQKGWLDYFWNIFKQLRGVTDIVNPGGDSRKWADFIKDYPAYDLVSRRTT